MALTELLFNTRRSRIGLGASSPTATLAVVELDATISERHVRRNEITAHPVEVGVDITDHVRRLPASIEIQGIVSNTPIVFFASLTEPPNRAEIADAQFLLMLEQGLLLDVVTSLRSYSNMMLTSYEVDRDAENGNVLNARLALTEVIQAFSQGEVSPTPNNLSRAPSTDKGAQPTSPAAENTEKTLLGVFLGG